MEKLTWKILKENRSDALYLTHVSMFKHKGKFCIDRNKRDSFWDAYCTAIEENPQVKFGIAEKPQAYLPVLVDVDIRRKMDDDEDTPISIYNNEHVKKLIEVYQNVLKQILEEYTDEDLKEVILPESPLTYDIIFTGGIDYVYSKKNDQVALAKEWQDFTGYVPIDNRSDSGYVVVNHERMNRDAVNGDGGGMTVMTVWKSPTNQRWQVVPDEDGHKYRNVDFSAVGGTAANCGGIQTSWGQVWTAEEWGVFFSNKAIMNPGLRSWICL